MTNSPLRNTIATTLSLLALGSVGAQAGETPAAFQPVLDAFLASAVSDCKDMDGGEFELYGGVGMVADFNGDGITDPVLDGRAMHCSTSATLFGGGSGGDYLTVFVSGNGGYQQFEFLSQGYAVVAIGRAPVLVMQEHGSSCDMTGGELCYAAYSWAEGAFHSAGGTISATR